MNFHKSEKLPSTVIVYPTTKQKNISCVFCRHHFHIRDFNNIKGTQVPLLLACGHQSCEGCFKLLQKKICPHCPSCEENISKTKLPLSVYTIGLLNAIQNRPIRAVDPDISFHIPAGVKLPKLMDEGHCYECGGIAILKCLQCICLYCNVCYKKMHQKALQNHETTLLPKRALGEFSLTNLCLICNDRSIEFYCKDCDTDGCSRCMILLHRDHLMMNQHERNLAMESEFNEVCNKLDETRARVLQSLQNLSKIMVFPENLQNSEAAEASINQHFALLHGVLQIQEIKLIEKLHEQRNNLTRNIEQVRQQLKVYEEQLQSGVVMISTVSNNFSNVNLRAVIDKLNEMASAPCHVLLNTFDTKENIVLEIDNTIIDALNNHCKIKVPEMPKYNLIPTSKLPEDYIAEPLEEQLAPRVASEDPRPMSRALTATSVASPSPLEVVDSIGTGGLPKGTADLVVVTHVNNPVDFYVQTISSQKFRINLDTSIATYVEKNRNQCEEIIENKLYIVQSEDNNWYRGRVTKVNEEPEAPATYEIFYIDFGFTENFLPANKIMTIAPYLMEIPPLAIHCSLGDIVPTSGEWTEEVLNLTKKIMRENDLRMVVKDVQGALHIVKMSKYPSSDGIAPIDIVDWLVFTCNDVKKLSTENLKRMNPNSVQNFYKSQLKTKAFETVRISHVESPNSIYVQLQGDTKHSIEQHLQKFNTDMNNEKSHTEYHPGDFPCIGRPCAVKAERKVWHRGIITDLPDQRTVEVFLVDVGSKIRVNYKKTRKLPLRYTNFSTHAIEVKLRDVRPPESDDGLWNPQVNNNLKLCLEGQIGKVMTQGKKNDVYEVDMYVDDVYVNHQLVSEGFAESTGFSFGPSKKSLFNGKKKSKKHHKANKHESANHNNVPKKNNDDMDLFKIRVRISKVESPDSIYVNLTSAEESYLNMQGEMNKFYGKRICADKPALDMETTYAVFSKKDKCYLRGKIVEICNEEIVVYLVDVAIEEIVAESDIYPLIDKFSKVPKLIFKIKLAGITPCGGTTSWLSTSCGFLKELITENDGSKFYISKLINGEKVSKDDTMAVDLWMKKTEVASPVEPDQTRVYSISRMLVDKGLAIPIRGYADYQDQLLAIEFRKQLGFNDINIQEPPTPSAIKHKLMIEIGPDTDTDAEDSSEDDSLSGRPRKDWLPPVIPPGVSFNAVGSYVDAECFVYVQTKTNNSSMLKFIENELDKRLRNFRMKSYDLEWKVGDICLAEYIDKKWYRAKVVHVKDENTFLVLFVDYGNTEEVTLGSIKKRVILRNIPVQCIKVKIAGLHPSCGTWKMDDLDRIHKLLVDQSFIVYPLDAAPGEYLESAIVLKNPKMELRTFIHTEMRISVHIDKLENSPNENGNGLEMESSSDILNGSSIANEKDEIDKDITDIESNISTDYENVGIVNSVHSMDKIRGNSGSELAVNEMEDDYVISRSVVAINDADLDSSSDLPSLGSLALSNERTKKLVLLGTSTPQDDSVVVPTDVDNRTSSPDKDDFTIPSVDYSQLAKLQFLEIEPGEMFNGVSFTGHLLENSHSKYLQEIFEKYSSIMEEMQMTASEQPMADIVTGGSCCAMYTDGIWYRCIILYVDDNEDLPYTRVKLWFIDYGNITIADDSQLRALKDEWREVPITGIHLKLWNIEIGDVMSDRQAGHELATLLGESRYVVSIKSYNLKKTFEIEFFNDNDPKTLAYQSLINKGTYKVVAAAEN